MNTFSFIPLHTQQRRSKMCLPSEEIEDIESELLLAKLEFNCEVDKMLINIWRRDPPSSFQPHLDQLNSAYRRSAEAVRVFDPFAAPILRVQHNFEKSSKRIRTKSVDSVIDAMSEFWISPLRTSSKPTESPGT